MFFRIGLFLSLITTTWAELATPYNTVKLLPFDDHGWFSNQKQLEECFKIRPIKTVIEVGSWMGLSARFLAEHVENQGKVYCVDNWQGCLDPTNVEVEAYHAQKERLSHAYQQFLSNIIHANLTDKIIPIRMESLEAAQGINILADLIYIDAGHAENAVFRDIMAWSEHLNANGILCGDDWTWPEVKRGVARAARLLGKEIVWEGNFWRLQ